MCAVRRGRVVGACTSDKCRAGKRTLHAPLLATMKPRPRIGDHMNEWLKPHIQETQAGMEVTSYLPAELDFA